MTPKLSNLDIPEIKSAAAEWALVSTQIENITLHRFKPNKLQNPEGPFYAIIIWVSPEVDVNIVPWTELLEDRSKEGKRLRKQLMKKGQKHPKYKMFHQAREQVREQVREHPLSGLWNLVWELSAIESKERECFYSFYRDGFERPDPRFDWLVLLLNIGDEYVFEYYGLDDNENGSAVLFSRKDEVSLQTQAAGPAPAALPAPVVAVSPSDYIMRRREEGVNVGIIAFELHDESGNFKLSYLETARALGFDKDLHASQIDAIKQRGRRACEKGKALLQKQ
jgi:hypothetical protein